MLERGPVIASVLLCFLLAGCSSPVERPSAPVIVSRSTPSGGLEERARSVWVAYFESYSRALASPSVSADSVAPYLSDAEYKVIGRALLNFQDSGKSILGATSTRNFKVLNFSLKKRSLTALVCVDNGSSKIVDSENNNVTPKDRKREFTVRLEFVTEDSKLVIDEDQVWPDSVC